MLPAIPDNDTQNDRAFQFLQKKKGQPPKAVLEFSNIKKGC
jgi:hypothetical protein